MSRSRPILIAALLAGCAGAQARPPEVGEPAPPFTAFTMDGVQIQSESFLGRPYMLNVWATWCGPCRREMPDLQDLHDAYADRGFQVVGVSVDNRAAGDAIRMFVDELDIRFPILHDPTAAVQDTYFLIGLPGTFLMDAEGTIVRKWMGPFQPLADDVRADVEALLASSDRAG